MADKKISELPSATAPTGTELVEIVQGGVNKQTTAQDIADLASGGVTSVFTRSGAVVAASGDYTATQVTNTPAGGIAATTVQAAIDELDTEKVDKETFTTLTFASPTVWACDNRQTPLAQVTATGSFTIDMTNVKDGAAGTLKIITNTASAITLTFDTSFTNKKLGATGDETFTTYTFPAATGKEFILSFVAVGTTLHWVIQAPLPAWTDFTQTFEGFSGTPTYTCRYLYDAEVKNLRMYLAFTAGSTSNATTFTFRIPIAAANTGLQCEVCQVMNNGTNATGMALTRVGSDVVDVYATLGFGAFTASGNKSIRICMDVETI